MPSTKPKIQLYLDKDVEPYLRNWLIERHFTSDSIGLNQLLREHFNIEEAEKNPPDWKHLVRAEIQSVLMPLAEKIATIDKRLFEMEAQMHMERESPQLGINQEAMESVWMQQEVIREMQSEIDSLRESLGDSPLTDTEQIDNEIDELLADAPVEPPDLDECAVRVRAILEAQYGDLNQEKLKDIGEGGTLQLIYALHNNLYVEEAEEIHNRLLAGIPKNPPLSEILISDSEEEAELNFSGNSPSDSPSEIEEMAEDDFSGTPEDLEAEIAEQEAYELAMGGLPKIENPFERRPDAHQKAIARLLAEYSPDSPIDWLHRKYLDITPAFISQETFELFVAQIKGSEQDLMNAIYERYPGINVEDAEAIYKLIKEGDSPSDSPSESEPEKPLEELNHNELVARLNTKSNTLRGRRNQPGFNAWSQQKDPTGLAWQWDGFAGVYRGFKVGDR